MIIAVSSSFSLASSDNYNLSVSKQLLLQQLANYIQNKQTENELKVYLCDQVGPRQVPGPKSIVHNGNYIYPNFKDYCATPDYVLSSRTCNISSRNLRTMLQNKFGNIGIKIVQTNKAWSSGYYHTYLIIPDFYSIGEHLIIDPTHTQFILDDSNKAALLHPDNHLIFIGSFSELKSIHTLYDPNSEVEKYRDIRFLGN